MTGNNGQTGVERAEEIAQYVEAVRVELADLPETERTELLEDLTTHLTEVAAEDPSPLVERLGPPSAYAAELRATAVGAPAGPPPPKESWWDRHQIDDRLRILDGQAGRLIGYERLSDFARLLIPAWWVLRGYLAAMLFAAVANGSNFGLIPRLGNSTVIGLGLLAAAVAGSIWLGHRTPSLQQWQRLGLYGATAILALFAFAGFLDVDQSQRAPWDGAAVSSDYYYGYKPYTELEDVYVIDENGALQTGVRLLDQHGNPIDIGYAYCDQTYPEEGLDGSFDDAAASTASPLRNWSGPVYPRCPDTLPWWVHVAPSPDPGSPPDTDPTQEPSPSPSPESESEPEPESESEPEPSD